MKSTFLLAALATLCCSAGAGTIGSAASTDVTLGATPAASLYYANGVNLQSEGKGGASAAFSGAFANTGTGSWLRLAAFDVNADDGFMLASSALGPTLKMTFDRSDERHGSWSISNTSSVQDVMVDLVFAIHTGGGSGAFLFDGQQLLAGSSNTGSWALNLRNNGGQYSGYSNLTIFARDAVLTGASAGPGSVSMAQAAAQTSAIPEPAPLLLTGLGLLALMVSRRRPRSPVVPVR